jgi:hypothetical protein
VSVVLQGGEGGTDLLRSGRAPSALLVRPDGAVRIDSLTPFSFGSAARESLGECWRSVREGWRDPRVERWRSEVRRPQDWHGVSVVPYLDDEVDLRGPGSSGSGPREAAVPPPVAPGAVTNRDPIDDPAAFVRDLALSRRYRLGAVRVGGDDRARIVRRTDDGRTWRLNAAASLVLGALDGGSARDAGAALRDGFPSLSRGRADSDALAAARKLSADRLVIPAEAAAAATILPGSPTDMPDVELS